MKRVRNSPHYSLLRESFEYYFWRRRFWISLIFLAAYTVPLLVLLLLLEASQSSDISLLALISLVLLGYSAFCAHRWRQIFRSMDDYLIFEAILHKPVLARHRLRTTLGYSITFPNSQGQIITRETAPMFPDHSDPRIPNFCGCTMLVGYNEETDRLVVIKRVY